MKINNPLDRSFTPFSESDTTEVIKASKNLTAAGPNGITMLHLRQIGPLGTPYLTSLFNFSVQGADIPALWKSADVIPVQKPGKPSDQGSSYRPILLLCPLSFVLCPLSFVLCPVLERLNLKLLKPSLSTSSSQHGFKTHHSTISAVLPLTTQISMQ